MASNGNIFTGPFQGRYDWAIPDSPFNTRITNNVLDGLAEGASVLDPFCSTGSVLLPCAYRGVKCTGYEIDPFFEWVSKVKTAVYPPSMAKDLCFASDRVSDNGYWENETYEVFQTSNVARYGDKQTDFLKRIRFMIDRETDTGIHDLLMMAFCRLLLDVESIPEEGFDDRAGMQLFSDATEVISKGIDPVPERMITLKRCDGRNIPAPLIKKYDAILSYLPWPGRRPMEKECRTFMQWLGFLHSKEDFKRIDDDTLEYPYSNLREYMCGWVPDPHVDVPGALRECLEMLRSTGKGDAPAMADYVRKYFEGLRKYVNSSKDLMKDSCVARYVVSSTSFFGTTIPTDEVFLSIAEDAGLTVEGCDKVRVRDRTRGLADYCIRLSKP